MPKCDFCKSDFHDKSTLNKHQRNSKYCIKIQLERDPTKLIEQIIFECDFCHKNGRRTSREYLIREGDYICFECLNKKLSRKRRV